MARKIDPTEKQKVTRPRTRRKRAKRSLLARLKFW